jgi:hypothetical protein
MRIYKGQIVAGYPALEVRRFLRRYRLSAFVAEAAEEALELGPADAATFLRELVTLEPVNPPVAD